MDITRQEQQALMDEFLNSIHWVGEVADWKDHVEETEESEDEPDYSERELKGGVGSGNFGHSGREGKIGGSSALAGSVNRVRNLQSLDSNSKKFDERVAAIIKEFDLGNNNFEGLKKDDIPYVLEALVRLPKTNEKVIWKSHTKQEMRHKLEELALSEGLPKDAFSSVAAGISTPSYEGFEINLHTLSDNEWFSGLNLPSNMHSKAGTMSAVAAHEYGHVLDKYYKHSLTSNWEDALASDKAVSGYARVSKQEAFAESVALMSIRPAYFHKKYPNLYKALAQELNWDPASKLY